MTAKPTLTAAQAAALDAYERLVATVPGVERKGASLPYTSVNGNMFSYLAKDGRLNLRLPAEARAEFLAKYHARLAESYGVIQKEYVSVPPALLVDTPALRPYFEQSAAYARGLKPKATTRGGAQPTSAPKKRPVKKS